MVKRGRKCSPVLNTGLVFAGSVAAARLVESPEFSVRSAMRPAALLLLMSIREIIYRVSLQAVDKQGRKFALPAA
jgi:hypothetical protein